MNHHYTGMTKFINEMERQIIDKTPPDNDYTSAREKYIEAIANLCKYSGPAAEIESLLDFAKQAPTGRREASILTLRVLAIDGFFIQSNLLDRRIVDLITTGFNDQLKNLKLNEKRQTFEHIGLLKGFHSSICSHFVSFLEIPPDLEDIYARKDDILRTIKNSTLGAYLQPYKWPEFKGKIQQIITKIPNILACTDATYKSKFTDLTSDVADLRSLVDNNYSFLSVDLVKPFLVSLETALENIKSTAGAQFTCTLHPQRTPPSLAEKKYPLHVIDKGIYITIPFVNDGPGMAIDVQASILEKSGSSLKVDVPDIRLGDVPPGNFALAFLATITTPTNSVDIDINIAWSSLFGEKNTQLFSATIIGQDPNINWNELEQVEPYSLEVADEERFVGRISKVQAIGNRLLKHQMSSTYITGQKRIGKTSLAQAVLRYVKDNNKSDYEYETLYIEWGEYCTPNPVETISALGENIYAFLDEFLQKNTTNISTTFNGSLSPLNIVARNIETIYPKKRFIIVLDEFDEIHPEMYRFGSLAETFFANLRTLSARKNIAFILVGGEKMPFIISAQGDQLNKFIREPLDYFSRSSEWEDYVKLVTLPTIGSLNWENSAVSELFNQTQGHPYYTKLVCSSIFSNAVMERDSEIIASDIQKVLKRKIADLDINSFAHFWKDGISGEREESEVIELKRLRVLVAWGRASRTGAPTKQRIIENINNTKLQSAEVGPIIDDFCRRDIMRENSGAFVVQPPLFSEWIKEVGVTKLISSTLADDIENEIKKANDRAYVKSSELVSLVSQWPLYRGNKVTDENVRAWLEQVSSPLEQRLLFKILQNIKFISPVKIYEMLQEAHTRIVAKNTPPLRRESKQEKRRDLVVTYIDGPGKSGALYARHYAKENGLLMESVVDSNRVHRKIIATDGAPSGIVIVDDLSATGETMKSKIPIFLESIHKELAQNSIPLFIIIMFATEAAEHSIHTAMADFPNIDYKLHIGEKLDQSYYAFPEDSGIGFWSNTEERDRAKALCVQLGTGLYPDPLGYGSCGLLINFSDGCPNNSLPILFAAKSGKPLWSPLFLRASS